MHICVFMLLVVVAGVMGEETRKMQRDRTGATQENSREATPTGLQQKDVIPVRSGLLPPLLRGQQPGMPAYGFATWEILPLMLLTCSSNRSCYFVIEMREMSCIYWFFVMWMCSVQFLLLEFHVHIGGAVDFLLLNVVLKALKMY
jgi:hypothetical protein